MLRKLKIIKPRIYNSRYIDRILGKNKEKLSFEPKEKLSMSELEKKMSEDISFLDEYNERQDELEFTERRLPRHSPDKTELIYSKGIGKLRNHKKIRDDILDELEKLRFIKHIEYTDKEKSRYKEDSYFQYTIYASSHKKYGIPVTIPDDKKATGILIYVMENEINIHEITSKIPGAGTKMVKAILNCIPIGSNITIHHDWSEGFWYHIAKKFPQYNWFNF